MMDKSVTAGHTEATAGTSPVLDRAGGLGRFTPARVGLRMAGTSLATSEILDFQLAHARARDAVYAALQPAHLMADLRTLDWPADGLPRFLLHSQAADRRTYLQRPDLGRKLDESSRILLENFSASEGAGIFDLSIVFADGLSALAVERHAGPLLAQLLPLLAGVAPVLRMAPTSILEQARVAAGDEVAMALHASLVVVLIGERPGLSSPDSLGAYITWKPNSGTTDANRNCISNIRSEGLSYRDAAARLLYYIREAHRLEQTGIALKDPSDEVCQALLHTTRETLPAETGPSL